MDPAGRVRSLNDRGAEILGLKAADVVGQPALDAFRRYPPLARLLASAASMSTPPDRAEMEVRGLDNEPRILGYTLSRVAGAGGKARGAALFFKDLTPIERREQQQRLQERLAALGSMAASLAHEIRNPLAALEVTTTLLRRKLPGEGPVADLLATLQEQIRRLSQTVNASLEYVRPLALQIGPCDPVVLVEEALQACAPARVSPRVEIVRWFRPVEARLMGDAARLREALVNLIRNALQAMAEGPGVLKLSVDVAAEAAGSAGTLVLRVSDTGPGIPDDIRPKIFNPFYSTKSQGSGLGLAWTRKVVEAHHGAMDVDSHPGEGAVFTMRLPLAPAATATESNPAGDTLDEAQDPGRRG